MQQHRITSGFDDAQMKSAIRRAERGLNARPAAGQAFLLPTAIGQ
ncbi:hypothetical protein [Burkholderia ubonensis]